MAFPPPTTTGCYRPTPEDVLLNKGLGRYYPGDWPPTEEERISKGLRPLPPVYLTDNNGKNQELEFTFVVPYDCPACYTRSSRDNLIEFDVKNATYRLEHEHEEEAWPCAGYPRVTLRMWYNMIYLGREPIAKDPEEQPVLVTKDLITKVSKEHLVSGAKPRD